MNIFFLHLYRYAMFMLCTKRPENGVRSGCEPLRVRWKLNPSPPQEQKVILIPEFSIFPVPEFFKFNFLSVFESNSQFHVNID